MRRRIMAGLVMTALLGCEAESPDAGDGTTETAAQPAPADAPGTNQARRTATAQANTAADAGRVLEIMQADLRNLLISQEAHYAMEMRYVGPVADVNAGDVLHYQTAEGVTVEIVQATDAGWSGVARSAALPGRGCAVFVGNVSAPTTPGGRVVTREATPLCDG